MLQTIPDTGCTYQELSHTSEIGIRLEAESAADLFSCAAQAMFHLVAPGEVVEIENEQSRPLTINSADQESLLVDWLNDLLYFFETSGVVFRRFEISHWTPTSLEATISGGRPQTSPAMHIKAVTYHQLQVKESGDQWQAQVYFDI